MTDDDLVRDFARRRSAAAFESLVARHAGWVHALARRRVGDPHAADDVTQAVFLLLARKASTLRDGRRVGAWLARTTHLTAGRHLRDERRRRRRERVAAARRPTHATPAAADAVAAGRLAALDLAVDRLGPRDRQTLTLRFYQGLSLAEVGLAQGVSADTARKRVDAAVARLRSIMADAPAVLAVLPAVASVGVLIHSASVARASLRPAAASVRSVGLARKVCLMWKLKQLALTAFVVCVGTFGLAFGLTGAEHAAYDGEPAPTTRPSPYLKNSKPVDRLIFTKGVLVRISADASELNAFSIVTGKTAKAPAIDAPFDRELMLSDNIAVYAANRAVLAFGVKSGTWSELPIPDGVKVNVSTVASELALVTLNDDLYIYSVASGQWVGPLP